MTGIGAYLHHHDYWQQQQQLQKMMDDAAYLIACAVADGRTPPPHLVVEFAALKARWLASPDVSTLIPTGNDHGQGGPDSTEQR